ncbi:GtrA family protein [Pedobacter sp. MC2016-14]|uniref:GtrA family protein n=1 Tax=Pedobacter sp. MC2016-14 TaxID=2897327 RepID=UPI001E4B35AA|nr:GtrA family protein [Pedobacter sp. MC2016-14]MCD0489311.1 GtrA family protein [Pedobacter sp. MC2016-14]
MKKAIHAIIDFFYPPFEKYIPRQTFRYAVSGGSNAALNLCIFFLSYNFIFTDNVVYFGNIALTRYIAAYAIALSFSFPVGFLLNKYIVFQESDLKAEVQLFRYATVTAMSIYFDYALLHFLVGYLKMWATPAQALIIVILSLFSYFFQTYVTFTKKKQKH